MILIMDNEIDPEQRYLGPELAGRLPDTEYHIFPEDPRELDVEDFDGVVLSGSTASIYDDDHADWISAQESLFERCLADRIPLLGICFGHQLVNRALGGTVEPDQFRTGFVRLTDVDERDSLLQGAGSIVPVYHGDVVTAPGNNMVRTASTQYNEYFCTQHKSAPVWTVQFHPEMTPSIGNHLDGFYAETYSFTDSTAECVLENFLRRCGVKR